jgi:hypothetical protein
VFADMKYVTGSCHFRGGAKKFKFHQDLSLPLRHRARKHRETQKSRGVISHYFTPCMSLLIKGATTR